MMILVIVKEAQSPKFVTENAMKSVRGVLSENCRRIQKLVIL